MVIQRAKEVLRIEAEAIRRLIERIDENFTNAVDLIYYCRGRVVVIGMGKSGLIGKKIVSTLASTGTPALFIHPAEGLHGDLGMIVPGDIVVLISNSGETEELNKLLPSLKKLGVKLIALTGGPRSLLAKNSDVILDVSVEEEACPLGVVPTASTTATLAMGDALAMALLDKRGFKEEDFAFFHPGGKLGKKWLKVKDLMHIGAKIPAVSEEATVKEAILEMSSKGLGVTGIVNAKGALTGIITDGDLRRMLEKDNNFFGKKAKEVMTKNPKIIDKETLAIEAVQVMEDYFITSLLIVDKNKKVEGIIHLHDILKAGVV